MIICGFAGIGKTVLSKNRGNWIDLESTPFEKDWDRYIKVATHMNKQGYNVMMSCHQALREELNNRKVNYILAIPTSDLKEEYFERYNRRGNTAEFIQHMKDNWDDYTSVYPWEEDNVMYLHKNEYLSDMI